MLNELGIENLVGSAIEPCLHVIGVVKQHVLNLPLDLHASLGHWLHHANAAFQGSGGGGTAGGSSSGAATVIGGAAAGGAAGGAIVQGGKSAKNPGTR